MSREELAAKRSVLVSSSGVNPEFAGKERDSRGKEGSGRHTGREPCWHGERNTNQRPTRPFSWAIPYFGRAGHGKKGGNAHHEAGLALGTS